jgi:hypothetical protein
MQSKIFYLGTGGGGAAVPAPAPAEPPLAVAPLPDGVPSNLQAKHAIGAKLHIWQAVLVGVGLCLQEL